MLTDGSEIRNNDLKKLKITEEDVGERKGSPLIWKDDLYTKILITNKDSVRGHTFHIKL